MSKDVWTVFDDNKRIRGICTSEDRAKAFLENGLNNNGFIDHFREDEFIQ